MDGEDAFLGEEKVQLVLEACQSCGRKFNKETLEKHIKICKKLSTKKRSVFDSTKQRAEALDLTVQQMKDSLNKQVAVPKGNWKAKHQEFLNSLRNAKEVSQAVAAGKPLPPPPPPAVNPDYVQCEYCKRRFNQAAADRHVTFCKEQHLRMNKNTGKNKTVNKTKPRTQIEPSLKSRTKTESSSAPSLRSTQHSTLAAAPSWSGNLQEHSGLRRPGFTSRLPSATNNKAVHSTSKFGKDTQRQVYDEYDSGTRSGGDTYTGRGPALANSGRGGKSYSDVKSVNNHNRIAGGFSAAHHGNKTIPNSYTRNPAKHHGSIQEAESGYHSNNSMNGRGQFCHNCSTNYPVVEAKFCCECGVKRLLVR